MSNDFRAVLNLLPASLSEQLTGDKLERIEEIRLRSGRRAELCSQNTFTELGEPLTPKEISAVVSAAAGYSLYAREAEIASGYLTIPGGHRVGFCGRCFVRMGEVEFLDSFSGVNIRLCRESLGCSQYVLPHMYTNGQVGSTLLLSPPGVGKTTLLRDLARVLSNSGLKTVIIDERSELAASSGGVYSLDVGRRTDVLDGAPKARGIIMAIRSLSPQLIVTDEIGSSEDAAALMEAAKCGVRVLASAHAGSLEELTAKPYLSAAGSSGVFSRFIFIERQTDRITPRAVYDERFSRIYPSAP